MRSLELIQNSAPCLTVHRWMHGAVLFVLAVFSMTMIQPALAQQDTDQQESEVFQIEEVIVTARKREESLQETPISITAFTTDELRERNLTNLVDVMQYTPNVFAISGTGGGGANAHIYIRGVGQSDFLFTTDPGVGIYMDGVYLPRTLGGVLDLLDIERVEILRGPQGTLFGKNTIGGAINVISNKPTEEFGGYAEVVVGSFNRTDGRLDMNIPLSKTWASRFSLSYKKRDGYIDRLEFGTDRVLDHLGNENAFNARGSLRWTPSEATTLDIIVDYTREREESTANALVDFRPLGGLAPLWNALVGIPGGLPMSGAFIPKDKHTTYGTGPNHNDLDVKGINVTLEHEFSSSTFKSISAYREMDAIFGRDADGSPLTYLSTDDVMTQEQFSQEFQLFGTALDDKFDWLVGAFYMNEKGTDRNEVLLATGLYDALEGLPFQLSGHPCGPPWFAPGCPGNPINPLLDIDFDIYNAIEISSYAVFTQLGYQVSERWNINGGIRYTDESKDYTLEHIRVNSGVPIIPLTTVSDSWSEPSGKVGVDFQANENVLLYGSISRGFKSGGFNGRPTTQAAVDSFNPEFVISYELGLKTELADRRVRLNAAIFFMDYTDMQVGSQSADESGNLVLIIDNAAKAEVKGFEFDFLAVPTERWMISAGAGYTDARYTDTSDAVGITTDSKFVNTPEWTTNASLQYALPLGGSFGELRFRGDWSYRSKVYYDIQNTEVFAQPSFSLLGARITLHNDEHDWDVVLSGTNLTDEVYITYGAQAYDAFGYAEAIYAVGRQWALSFNKRF